MYEVFSKEEERELFEKFKQEGCLDSRNKLVFSQTRFIHLLCNKFCSRNGFDEDDAFGESLLELIKQIKNFNPDIARLITFTGVIVRNRLRNVSRSYTGVGYYPMKAVKTEKEAVDNFVNYASLSGIDLVDHNPEQLHENAQRKEKIEIIKKAFEFLEQREIDCLIDRYIKGKTFNQIGNENGVKRQMIQKIHNRAISKLKDVVGVTAKEYIVE